MLEYDFDRFKVTFPEARVVKLPATDSPVIFLVWFCPELYLNASPPGPKLPPLGRPLLAAKRVQLPETVLEKETGLVMSSKGT